MKKIKQNLHIIFLLLIGNYNHAQQVPAPTQNHIIAISGATAHIGNGEVINKSIIIFENGKISFIGPLNENKYDLNKTQHIQAHGKHIYPGFIIPNSTLGLVEIDAVRASDDENEIGGWNPHIRSLIAYNTESKVVESMRPNGVLIGQITPRGGRISGTSSVVQFDAWNWEDAVIAEDDGIHINWPNNFDKTRSGRGNIAGVKPNSKYHKQLSELNQYFEAAKANSKSENSKYHLPYTALMGLFDGSKALYVNVNDEKGIIDVINFKNKNGIKKLVIVGGYEAHKIAELLKKEQVAVLLRRVHSTPQLTDDDYDLPYKLASILFKKGVLVGLQASGSMERMNSRNLPFYAGTTAAHGLTKEEALQLITANNARILGIDDRYGTLKIGKSATFFISEGDALDMRTNKLTHAFIDGRSISLESHQTKLWKRYEKKYQLNGQISN
jgi:hypothetical protein